MKKLVVKLELQDGKAKQKALKIVSTIQEIDSIAVDMKEKKLIVVGTVDPINVVSKLRKYWHTDIVLVGPAKEPEKKKEAAKATGAEESKKVDGGKDSAAAAKTDQQAEPKKEDQEQQNKKEGGEEDQAKKEGEEGKKISESKAAKKEAEKKKVNEAIINYNYDPRVLEPVSA